MAEEAFLSLIESKEMLYDKTHPDFKNAKLKDFHWENIGSVFKITGKEAQLKFKNLRQKYVREKNLEQAETRSGAGTSKRVKWHLMPLLGFLDDHIKPRKTTSNLSFTLVPDVEVEHCEEEHNDDNFTNTWVDQVNALEETFIEDDEGSIPVAASSSTSGISTAKETPDIEKVSSEALRMEPPKKRLKKNKNSHCDEELTNVISKLTNSLENETKNNHIQAFSVYVAEQLHRLPENESDVLMAEISSMICKKILERYK